MTVKDRATLPTETPIPLSGAGLLAPAEGAAPLPPECLKAQETSALVAVAQPIVGPMRGKSPLEILDHVASLLPAIQIPKETLEIAEEIVSGADAPGIENESLLLMLRVAIFLDRQHRVD